jgi:hypothetical protein
MIKGIVASLVPNPTNIRIEQNTSAKTARPRDISGVSPRTGGNCTGSPDSNIVSLGNPCVSIKAAMAILNIRILISML